MRRLLLFLICCAPFPWAHSQVVVNKYAAVTAGSPCGNTFTVDDATDFNGGDTILMIQMKGATIDSANSASFGTVLSYNGAGNYEFNIVRSKSGNNVTLLYTPARSYDIPAGRVQFVRVPYFRNYTVSQPHSCLPWTGTKGGIVVINTAGALTLNADIDVSSRGFRSGNLAYANIAPCAKMDYYYANVPNSYGAEKGEGIAELSAAKSNGRGVQANGGGGGNSSNGGGGGAGNGGAGGMGGKETAIALCAPAQQTGGFGGLALNYSNTANKVFMGGGAGAGHANNNDGGNGNPGGGIVLLSANQLTGNGKTIKADGGDGIGCSGDCWDGQPGGSAGGSILLNIASYNGGVLISAKGGTGGSHGANNTASGANGPGGGGGGGGGVLWVKGASLSSQVTATLSGGARGVFTNNNDPWGTTNGSAGISMSGLNISFPTDTFKGGSMNISFKDSVVDCFTRAMVLLSPAAAPGIFYSWNFGNGNTSNARNPSVTFPDWGTYTVTLTVSDGSGCSGSYSRQITISPNPGSKTDTAICAGRSILLSASGGNTYSWAPATGLSSTTSAGTIATPAATTTYIVTISAGAGCTYKDTFTIRVSPLPKADFIIAPVVANQPVQFTNQSRNAERYSWSFGDGDGSTETSPSHLYTRSGSYRVCLLAASSAGCSDSVCKNVDAEVKDALGVANAFTPNGDGVNDILYVRGAGIATLNFRIYNRWGQAVFESQSLSQGWDGTYKGQPQEVDLYAYVVSATFIDGSAVTKKGNINLLR